MRFYVCPECGQEVEIVREYEFVRAGRLYFSVDIGQHDTGTSIMPCTGAWMTHVFDAEMEQKRIV